MKITNKQKTKENDIEKKKNEKKCLLIHVRNTEKS